MIREERIKKTFWELALTNSPSRAERPLCDYLQNRLQGLGLTVWEDGAAAVVEGNSGNLHARAGDRVRRVLMAHMDTVQPTIGLRPQLMDDMITAQGGTILGADDKAGITAILEGLSSLHEDGWTLDGVQIIFTVAEEIGLLGAAALDLSDLRAADGFVFDSGGPVGTIIVQAPWEIDLQVTFHGRAAHSGVEPEKGRSAIQMLANAVDNMRLGRLDEESTANVGLVSGGSGINIVPAMAQLWAGARSLQAKKVQSQVTAMEKACHEAAQRFGGHIHVERVLAYPGFKLDEGDRVVRMAMAAARRIGLVPRLQSRGGGSDTNVLNGRGLKAVNLGIGVENDHTSAERVRLTDLKKCARLAEVLLRGTDHD
ncbi:MAG TPA: M20/M25/M40 family metallo-hydrolase [Firmicutes bacterium]|nr:M20/M25/M40 family metallo-hydrolase [Bacillota bacterium]